MSQGVQVDGCEGCIHAPPDLCRRETEVAGTEGHVLFHRHPYDLAVGVLEDHPHTPPDLRGVAAVPRAQAVDQDLAGCGDEKGVQVLQKRCLAAAVRTRQDDVLSRGDDERGSPQDGAGLAIVSEGYGLNLDHASLLIFSGDPGP